MSSTEKQRIEVINIPDFWDRLGVSQSRVLALDYDGTLAPFHVDPMKAHPFPGIKGLLSAISEVDDTCLAVISGRPVHEVLTLLGDLEITVFGNHGFEHRLPEGELIVKSPDHEQLKGLEKAAALAVQLGFGDRLETKIASIAFHVRGIQPSRASEMERCIFSEWFALAPLYGLECRRFNGGVEIRSIGFNKGDAIVGLLADRPPGSLNVFIGDDDTDEDAFHKLAELGIGLGIRVGGSDIPTAAMGLLPDCGAVKLFLETWLRVTSAMDT
jgi:trehalose 6-phosphate phosphatase